MLDHIDSLALEDQPGRDTIKYYIPLRWDENGRLGPLQETLESGFNNTARYHGIPKESANSKESQRIQQLAGMVGAVYICIEHWANKFAGKPVLCRDTLAKEATALLVPGQWVSTDEMANLIRNLPTVDLDAHLPTDDAEPFIEFHRESVDSENVWLLLYRAFLRRRGRDI